MKSWSSDPCRATAANVVERDARSCRASSPRAPARATSADRDQSQDDDAGRDAQRDAARADRDVTAGNVGRPRSKAAIMQVRPPALARQRNQERRADQRGDDADLQLRRAGDDAADDVGRRSGRSRRREASGQHPAVVGADDRADHVRDRPGRRRRSDRRPRRPRR